MSGLPAELSPYRHLVTGGALAADRHLPVSTGLEGLFPERALVRGQVVAHTGDAAVSLALAGVAQASAAGAWVAVVGVPGLGVGAAAEFGVALQRLVLVDVDPADPHRWTQLMGAATDGFEVIIAAVPSSLTERAARSVRQRLRARGSVVMALGPSSAFGADLIFDACSSAWLGAERGAGHLRARRVRIAVAGRRATRHRALEYWLPGPDGIIGPAATSSLTAVVAR